MQPYVTEFNKSGNFFETIVLSLKLTIEYREMARKLSDHSFALKIDDFGQKCLKKTFSGEKLAILRGRSGQIFFLTFSPYSTDDFELRTMVLKFRKNFPDL